MNTLKDHDKLKDYIQAHNTSWHRAFCFNGEIDQVQLLHDIEEQTGIKLIANHEGDIVHGFVTFCEYPVGTVGTCSWGLEPLQEGLQHTCAIISLHDENTPPTFDPEADPKARIGHKTHLKAIDKEGIEEKLHPILNQHQKKAQNI